MRSMASKLVLVLGICIFALLLLSPVTAVDDDHTSENPQATPTPSGPVVPPRSKHYVTGCKRCCYLDEYGCITCCTKGGLQAFLPTAGRKEKAALVANSGHQ